MSYPDLIEQNGRYWITETNKENARCHPVPDDFFDVIWFQFERDAVTQDNLIAQWNASEIQSNGVLAVPQSDNGHFKSGFTFDFRIKLTDIGNGQRLFTAKTDQGIDIIIQTAEYGSIEIVIKDGENTEKWNSDPGLINAYGEHCVAISVDNGSKIIQFVVDGTVCNGRDFRQYGWARFRSNLSNITFQQIEVGDLAQGALRPQGNMTNLKLYSRPLMNTEVIGNHRNFRE